MVHDIRNILRHQEGVGDESQLVSVTRILPLTERTLTVARLKTGQ